MQGYLGYGLRIRSVLELSTLVAVSVRPEEADVTIQTGEVPIGGAPFSRAGEWLRGDANEVVMYHQGLGFHISRGREIVVDAPGEESSWPLRLLLMGPVMAVLINQRGMLPLHASAVAVNGQVCAFLGESGWGKSTLAAALCQRGHPVVADDVLGIGFDETGRPTAYPAFPQLRIASVAASALGICPDSLPAVHRDMDERLLYPPADQPVLQSRLPLHSLYLLAVGDAHCIDRIQDPEAFGAIERHTYINRALLESTGTTREHLLRCAQLTRTTGIYRLQRPRSLEALTVTARMVEQACASHSDIPEWNLEQKGAREGDATET
jgi:hypothetical protein